MENRKALGTFGIVAIAAILVASLAVANLSTQQVQGAAQSANKVGTSTSTVTFITDISGSDLPAVIIEYDLKSSDKHAWWSGFITECTTQTLVKASGGKHKDSSSDTASAGALVWWTITGGNGADHLIDPYGVIDPAVWDGDPASVPLYNKWHICGQLMELKVNLNPLIVKCTAEQELAGLCTEGQLVFLCDVDSTIPEDECDQYVQIFLKNWGTHSAGTLIDNVPHGVHTVKVWGDSDIDPSDNVDPDDRTKVIIGKKVLLNTPILMDNAI